MKFILALFVLTFSIVGYSKDVGLGVSLGNPTGLNGKYWLGGNRAVDGGMGFSLGKNSDFTVHSDYLLHSEGAFFFNDVHPLDLYYGIGGRMEFSDDIELGVRVPVGLVHKVENGDADVFAEVAPIVNLYSAIGLELHVLIGGRYYFR